MTARRSRRAAVRPLGGRVAVVTGAGRGLGRAIAEGLAATGARVVVAARTRTSIRTTAQAIERAGGHAAAIPCDVRDPASVESLIQQTLSYGGRLDILVNSAGVFQIAALADTGEPLWESILATNLTGAYRVTRAALAPLVRSRGHIVNMISVAGKTTFPGNAAYCASKWGLLGFTNVLRDELRPLGVRVTAVFPGAVDTPIWDTVAGRWDRTHMLRPEAVAKTVVDACCTPDDASIDEITILPGSATRPRTTARSRRPAR